MLKIILGTLTLTIALTASAQMGVGSYLIISHGSPAGYVRLDAVCSPNTNLMLVQHTFPEQTTNGIALRWKSYAGQAFTDPGAWRTNFIANMQAGIYGSQAYFRLINYPQGFYNTNILWTVNAEESGGSEELPELDELNAFGGLGGYDAWLECLRELYQGTGLEEIMPPSTGFALEAY
jgi:hypothetical protein